MAEEKNVYIHFFVDKYDKIIINNVNNTESELREIYDINKDVPLLMFSYNFNSQILYVDNISESVLKYLLNQKKNSSKPSGYEGEALKQIDLVIDYLQKTYKWPGTITADNTPQKQEALGLNLTDFKLAYKFISLMLDSFSFEVVNLNIAVMEDLSVDSDFVHEGESVRRNGNTIKGPAILLRKNNSTLLTNRSIVFQYFFNLNKLYNINIASDDFYYNCIGGYIEEMFNHYLETGNVSMVSHWYVYTKNGNVYLEKTKSKVNIDDLIDKKEHSVGFTFSFVEGDESNYLIFEDMDMESIKDTKIYNEMYSYLIKHSYAFGHIDENGEQLSEDPVVIFLKQKSNVMTYMAKELPSWVYIKNIISPMYKFEPQDILVIRGNFDFNFSAKFLSEPSEKIVDLLSEYVDMEFIHFPLIIINDSDINSKTYSYNNHAYINEYLKYISHQQGLDLDYYYLNAKDMIEYLDKFINGVLKDTNKRIGLENEIIVNLETSKHHHDYNVFKYVFDVLGFEEERISRAISVASNKQASKIADLADEVLQKMYYVALKSVAVIFKTKYGHDMDSVFDLKQGDIGALNDFSKNLVYIKDVLDEGFLCLDVVTEDEFKVPHGKIVKFKLGACDEKEYNTVKTASVNDVSYYKNLLKDWLRNKNTKPIIKEKESEEVNKNLSCEELLRGQSEYYDWEAGTIITETLLGDNRRADDE